MLKQVVSVHLAKKIALAIDIRDAVIEADLDLKNGTLINIVYHLNKEVIDLISIKDNVDLATEQELLNFLKGEDI